MLGEFSEGKCDFWVLKAWKFEVEEIGVLF